MGWGKVVSLMKAAWLAVGGLIGLLFLSRKSKAGSLTPENPPLPPTPNPDNHTGYTVESWRPVLAPLLAGQDIPAEFALGWIRVESGGNPCAIGAAGDNGPDGTPREQGITQLYNPDDFKLIGLAPGSLRVYCIPGTQTCSRRLTNAEMQVQAVAHVAKIRECRDYVRQLLTTNHAQDLPGWATSGRDFWRLSKLVHGLPGLVRGFTTVTKELGHPPKSWDEFKNTILVGMKLDSATERYRTRYGAIFNNAERATAQMSAGEAANV